MPINWALIAGRLDFEKVTALAPASDQMGGGRIPVQEKQSRLRVGKGMVHAAGMVEITEGESKGTHLKAEKINQRGCKPRKVDEVEVDGKRVMTSREALAKDATQSIAIIGLEPSERVCLFPNAFGTKVTYRDAEHTAC